MALAIAARLNRENWNIVTGGKQVRVTRVTGDNSYPTGGWPLTKAQLGFSPTATLDFVEIEPANGFNFEYDRTNQKMKAYSAMGTELANASAALNTVVIRILAIGA